MSDCLDQTLFILDAESFDKFVATLDLRSRPNRKLKRLLAKDAPWETDAKAAGPTEPTCGRGGG